MAPNFLPMLPKPRPVDPEWKCCRSGDCCTIPKELVMTKEEAAVLTHHAPQTIALHFRPVDETFVALKTAPCPLYVFGGCLVYSVRPYNCRRYACLRPDPKTEKFGDDTILDRVKTSRIARRMIIHIQHKAQRWADKHGWNINAER